MTQKYPNADTSPERLAEIERNFDHANIEEWPGNTSDYVRDLLAMLQELHELKPWWETTGEKFDELEKLKQQLHDQRWRDMAQEWPQENQRIQFAYRFEDREEGGEEIFNRANYLDGSGMWWRPIPPLPTEK